MLAEHGHGGCCCVRILSDGKGLLDVCIYAASRRGHSCAKSVLCPARKRHAAQFAGDKNTNLDAMCLFLRKSSAPVPKGATLSAMYGWQKPPPLAFGFFNRKPGAAISYNLLRNMPGSGGKSTNRSMPNWGATRWKRFLSESSSGIHVGGVEACRQPAVTYDFTVPGTHSFIANGIVNHNSGGKTRRAAKMQ